MLIAKSLVVLVLLVATIVFAGRKFYELFKIIRVGRDPERSLTDDVGDRAGNVVSMVFGHKKVLEDPYSGFLHIFFLYGFMILGIGHTKLVIDGVTAFLPTGAGGLGEYILVNYVPSSLAHLYHFTQDFMAIAVVIMSVVALARRFSGQVKRLMPRSLDAEIILWFILALYVTFFVYESSGTALRQLTAPEATWHWSQPVSSAIAIGLHGMDFGPLTVINEIGFFSHLVVFLGFGAYIPMSKHMHLVFAGPNIYLYRRNEPVGLPPKIDFTDETLEKYGIDRVYEYSWKTVLDTFACTECGRCNSVCPAYTTGKPLQPKKVLHDLKDNLRYKNREQILPFFDKPGHVKDDKLEEWKAIELETPLINREEFDRNDKSQVAADGKYVKVDGQVHLDELWGCTTCAACVEACPVLIDSVPGSLIALRQNLVMMEADFPEELTAAFKGLEEVGNPWGVGQDKREDWIDDDMKADVPIMAKVAEEDRKVEYLYWVGCAGSTDDRAKKVQKALVKILKASKVEFAILGCEEKCTGDPARRMGNEYVFDMLAQENTATLEGYKDRFQKIFTACPHCFNSLKNEYGQYGADYEVLHHTQLLAELMKDKRIPVEKKAEIERVTFHDPCYLTRYNAEIDAARDVIDGLDGIDYGEMERSKERSFCCGAGGGRMWMEEPIGKRVNIERTEEALVTLGKKNGQAQTIAVGCPFCMTMVTDGTKAKEVEEDVAVKDVAELIADRLSG